MTDAVSRVKKLESALAGAMRAGDRQTDELVRLSGINARQRRALWRALNLIERDRPNDAASVKL
jgi:hypothetical protein